jgi:hypothetical protein
LLSEAMAKLERRNDKLTPEQTEAMLRQIEDLKKKLSGE